MYIYIPYFVSSRVRVTLRVGVQLWDLRKPNQCVAAFYAPLPLKCLHHHNVSVRACVFVFVCERERKERGTP